MNATALTIEHFEKYMGQFRGFMEQGFANLQQQIEDLAFATKTGFDNMDKQFIEVRQEMQTLHCILQS